MNRVRFAVVLFCNHHKKYPEEKGAARIISAELLLSRDVTRSQPAADTPPHPLPLPESPPHMQRLRRFTGSFRNSTSSPVPADSPDIATEEDVCC